MRAVVQRVLRAAVSVGGETISEIGPGICVLLGVGNGDTEEDSLWLADKLVNLRIFEDGEGRMERSLLDVGGATLLVSQFTLYGDCRKGRRPSFAGAAAPEEESGSMTISFAEFGPLGWKRAVASSARIWRSTS